MKTHSSENGAEKGFLNPRITLFLCSVTILFLVGCSSLKIDWIEKDVPIQHIQENKTVVNETKDYAINESKVEPIQIESGTYYFVGKGTTVVITNKTAIVIDTDGIDAINLLKNYGKEANALFVTSKQEKRLRGVKTFLFSMKPKLLFDTGRDSEYRTNYLTYLDELGINSKVIQERKTIGFPQIDVELFPPYQERGLSFDESQNSVPIRVNKLLYMSDCGIGCEDTVDDVKVDYIVLANNGHCPTNSFEFVQLSGAKVILGEELCQDFLSDAYLEDVNQLNILGIEFIPIKKITGVRSE